MFGDRPYVMTIAGFDPTGGAGLTADIKTFEQNRVYGLAVCSGLTLQTEKNFYSVKWRSVKEVIHETDVLVQQYPVRAIKFGIVPSLDFLTECVLHIKKKLPALQIVVDPVWKSSTGFAFAAFDDHSQIKNLLQHITLLTPNLEELQQMAGNNNPGSFAQVLAQYTSLLVKGGHDAEKKGTDTFYDKKNIIEIKPNAYNVFPKHGSGCVLSASITAHLALGYDVYDACVNGKRYTETFLASNETLLGYHAA